MEDIIRRAEFLKESGLLIKGVTNEIKNDANNKKVGFLACC